MNVKRRLRVIYGPLLIICFLPIASAEAPIKQDPVTFVIKDAFVTSCSPFGYGFDMLVDGSITWDYTYFFDKDGNLDRIRGQFRVSDGVYKNSTDSSKFIDLEPGWGATRWIDWQTGEIVQAGAYTRVTVPGYGAVAMGVGRLVISSDGVVTYSGQSDFLEGDLAALCSVLA